MVRLTFLTYGGFCITTYVGIPSDLFASTTQNRIKFIYDVEVVLYSMMACIGKLKPFRQFTKGLRLRWVPWY